MALHIKKIFLVTGDTDEDQDFIAANFKPEMVVNHSMAVLSFEGEDLELYRRVLAYNVKALSKHPAARKGGSASVLSKALK